MTISVSKRAAVRVVLLILWETLVAVRYRSSVSFTIGSENDSDRMTSSYWLAGHRTDQRHDCFVMNCSGLANEVLTLQGRISESPPPTEGGA